MFGAKFMMELDDPEHTAPALPRACVRTVKPPDCPRRCESVDCCRRRLFAISSVITILYSSPKYTVNLCIGPIRAARWPRMIRDSPSPMSHVHTAAAPIVWSMPLPSVKIVILRGSLRMLLWVDMTSFSFSSFLPCSTQMLIGGH